MQNKSPETMMALTTWLIRIAPALLLCSYLSIDISAKPISLAIFLCGYSPFFCFTLLLLVLNWSLEPSQSFSFMNSYLILSSFFFHIFLGDAGITYSAILLTSMCCFKVRILCYGICYVMAEVENECNLFRTY